MPSSGSLKMYSPVGDPWSIQSLTINDTVFHTWMLVTKDIILWNTSTLVGHNQNRHYTSYFFIKQKSFQYYLSTFHCWIQWSHRKSKPYYRINRMFSLSVLINKNRTEKNRFKQRRPTSRFSTFNVWSLIIYHSSHSRVIVNHVIAVVSKRQRRRFEKIINFTSIYMAPWFLDNHHSLHKVILKIFEKCFNVWYL